MTTAANSKRFAVIGHRGSSAVAPENTLTAFRRAQDDGADAIELDVHCTRDGVAVIMHDEDIQRTTSSTGLVAELDFAALANVKGADGLPVPTLTEALDSVSIPVQIEIKDPRSVFAVLDAVRGRSDLSRLVLSSFDLEVLKVVRRSLPEAQLGLITPRLDEAVIAKAVGVDASSVYSGIRETTRASIASAHDAGLLAYVWVINDEVGLRQAIELGADGVTTDDPGALVTLLGRRSE